MTSRSSSDDEVVIVGRLKEMINRNGQRVAASDFELAVQGTEGVLPGPGRGVRRRGRRRRAGRAARRVPLQERHAPGEVVLALRARLADAGLPADVVELVPAGFIPRTTSGKLRRGAARERWQAASRGCAAKRSSHARCRRFASRDEG